MKDVFELMTGNAVKFTLKPKVRWDYESSDDSKIPADVRESDESGYEMDEDFIASGQWRFDN